MGFEYGATAIGKLTRLMLGYAGEGGTRTIRIDVSEWMEQFPGAMIVIQMVRPQDRYKYFVSYTREKGILTWQVDHGEVKYDGKGLAQITMYNPDTKQEYKSRVVETIVARSLEEFNSMLLEEDDPAKKWVNQVLDAAKRAEEAVEQRMPYIGSNGNWWLWDAETGRYVDSGKPSVSDGKIPEKLPNPEKLIFTGAVEAEYDGSKVVYINIPKGGTGGGSEEPAIQIPAYWQAHIDARVDDVNVAMAASAGNRRAFLFYSDAHWTVNNKQSPALLRYLCMNTPIKKVIYGGDIVQSESNMDYLAEWRKAVSPLPSHHSVPGNHDDGNEIENRWDDDYIYDFLLADEATDDVVKGPGLYYYIDDTAEKTRYLYLDSATYDGRIAKDTTQQEWLKNTLISTPDGYHIVAVAHVWAEPDYSYEPPTAGELGTSAMCMLNMFDQYNAREGDFSACGGKVEFCVGGHNHRDSDYSSINGIPVILVETDSRTVRGDWSSTTGTITENSVNAIIADYEAETVDVIRIGRGASRTVKLNANWRTTYITRVLQTSNDTVAIEWADNASSVTYVIYDGSTEVARVNNNRQAVLFNVGAGQHIYTVLPMKDGELGERTESVMITTVADVGFTNVLRIAKETDTTTPYNGGYGYKENTRQETEDEGAEVPQPGWDVTGLIPVSLGDIIRMYNMEFYNLQTTSLTSTSWTRPRILSYYSDGSYADCSNSYAVDKPMSSSWAAVYGDDGDVIQFKFPTVYNVEYKYISIFARNIDAFSIITINEEINL